MHDCHTLSVILFFLTVLFLSQTLHSFYFKNTVKKDKSHSKHSQNHHENSEIYENTTKTSFIILKDRPDLGIKYENSAKIINPDQKYAVISVNRLPKNGKVTYAFQIPMCCSAWLAIGFGCFIILPYQQDGHPTQQATKLIIDTVTENNTKNMGNVIFMNLQVPKNVSVVQISQVSRLFVSYFLKYSMTDSEFLKIQSVNLITTDVDLLPLKASLYFRPAFDWNLVNLITWRKGKEIEVALSCIGATVKNWMKLVPKGEIGSTYFSANGIDKMIKSETEKELILHPNLSKHLPRKAGTRRIDWYIDQILAATWLTAYANRHGWEKLTPKRQDSVLGERVDRLHIGKRIWDSVVDYSIKVPYKDVHTCQSPTASDCWWKLYNLMSFHLEERDLIKLNEFRNKFLDLMISNSNIGCLEEQKKLRFEEGKRVKFTQELIRGKFPLVDLRTEWSHKFPRTYQNTFPYQGSGHKSGELGYRPMFVDWEGERLFKNMRKEKAGETVYFVIPKYKHRKAPHRWKSVDDLNEFAEEDFKKLFCGSCEEIIF